MSVYDAVDGSSTGTRVPRRWELLKLARFSSNAAWARKDLDAVASSLLGRVKRTVGSPDQVVDATPMVWIFGYAHR
jgi:hypothetical protein